jgi:hypothetical protein
MMTEDPMVFIMDCIGIHIFHILEHNFGKGFERTLRQCSVV